MTKIALFLRLNNFIQPLVQLRDDGLYVADLMNPPASHTTSLLPSFKSAAVALAWTWTCDVFGLVEARSCPWPDHVRGQFTVTADSWSRSGRVAVHVRGQGVAIVWPFCGHFVDTESFTDEGVGRALG
jgi:hypothetical protein